MKCTSCEAEINPKWVHAIEQNICPFCGKSIMEEHLKNLFTSLRDTMSKLSEHPDQLNDWMLSNYNYIKTDSKDLHLYSPKGSNVRHLQDNPNVEILPNSDNKYVVTVKTDKGEENIIAEKIQTDEKTNEFFKRAEAVKPNIDGFKTAAAKNDHLRKIVQQIKKSGTSSINEDGDTSSIPNDMIENADPEAVAEFISVMDEGNMISSALASPDGDDIPASVLNMASKAGKGGHSNAADLLKLQQMQSKSLSSRRDFENGSNRGKNGFSRSS